MYPASSLNNHSIIGQKRTYKKYFILIFTETVLLIINIQKFEDNFIFSFIYFSILCYLPIYEEVQMSTPNYLF